MATAGLALGEVRSDNGGFSCGYWVKWLMKELEVVADKRE